MTKRKVFLKNRRKFLASFVALLFLILGGTLYTTKGYLIFHGSQQSVNPVKASKYPWINTFAVEYYDTNAATAKKDAEHFDVHMNPHSPDLIAANAPGSLAIKYIILDTEIKDSEGDAFRSAMNKWAQDHGVDVEDMYIHYQRDIKLCKDYSCTLSDQYTIKGWDPVNDTNGDGIKDASINPKANAQKRSDSRVYYYSWLSFFNSHNLGNPSYQQFMGDYCAGELTKNPAFSGLMADTAIPNIKKGDPAPNQVEYIAEYANTQDNNSPDNAKWDRDFVSLVTYIRTQINNKLVIPNTSGYEFMALADAGGGEHQEMYYHFKGDQSPYKWDYLKQQSDKGKYSLVLPSWETYGNDNERERMHDLAWFYVGQQPYTYLGFRGFGYVDVLGWAPNGEDWFKALETDIGTPVDSTYQTAVAESEGKKDPAGQTYAIFTRKYSKALIVTRPKLIYDNPNDQYGNNTGVIYNLPSYKTATGTSNKYKALRTDGTLGPEITQVTLRMPESAILFPSSTPISSSPSLSPSISPTATTTPTPTPTPTPPSAPTNLNSTTHDTASITLNWNTVSGAAGYKIFRDNVEVGTIGTTTYKDTGLNPDTNYSYYVKAYNANGLSAQSNTITVKTDAITPPADTQSPTPPSNLKGAATTTTIALSWTASTDNVGVTGYKVYRNSTLISNTTTTNYTDSGLTASTTYSYYATAFDAAGNTSSKSNVLSITTSALPPDTTPPSIPQNLRSTGKTATSITLCWNDSTDNVGVVGYKVYRQGIFIGSTTTTCYTNSNLLSNTSYTYTVRAYDKANNISAGSTSVSVITDKGAAKWVIFAGTVSNKTTGKGVPSASVKITSLTSGTSYTMSTNSAGQFSRDTIPVGEYKINISANYYVTYIESSFTISGAQSTFTKNISMEEGILLSGIVKSTANNYPLLATIKIYSWPTNLLVASTITSSATGKYTFNKDIAKNTIYTMKITANGYQPQTKQINTSNASKSTNYSYLTVNFGLNKSTLVQNIVNTVKTFFGINQ